MPFLKTYSPTLIPQTDLYMWGTKMHKLPHSIAEGSVEGKRGFVELIKKIDKNSFMRLKGDERKIYRQEQWLELSKNIPQDKILDRVFMIASIAGIIYVITVKMRAKL